MAASDSAYARLVRQESRLRLCRQYAELRERELLRAADARADAFEAKQRRALAKKDLGLLDRDEVVRTVYDRKMAEYKEDLHLEYCEARETARRSAEKEPDKKAALDASVEALRAGQDQRLADYGKALRAAIETQLPPSAPAEASAEAARQMTLAAEERRGALRAGAEKDIAALKARTAKKTAKLESSCEALRSRAERGKWQNELPEGVVLRVEDLCMYFGGVHAVDGLSFDVKKGEIFGLIGPNGAGKTTVFNCITQFYKPTSGKLFFENKAGEVVRLTDERVHDVILQGIVRTFQNVEVIREVTVLENLLIAGHRQFTAGVFAQALHLPSYRREERVVREQALRVLDFMGLTEYRDWYAYGLPYGILKKIEIARTLMCSPQLIILDEPAAGLNDTETAELAELIRRIRSEYDCTILLVEHDMGLVMDICETICAISFGKRLAIGTPAEIQASPEVQKAYLGESDDKPASVGKEGV